MGHVQGGSDDTAEAKTNHERMWNSLWIHQPRLVKVKEVLG
jgi:hypothetical protein